MKKSAAAILWAGLVATGIGILPVNSPARADEPADAASANGPDRERDLIAILTDAQKALRTSRSASPAQDARIAMQVRVTDFMRKSQDVKDWVGTVKSHGLTPEGDAWITIEIAENITIGTWQSAADDRRADTLLRQHSALFKAVNGAKIGQSIIFSGRIVNSVLSDDDDMVTHPRFIGRFTALRIAQ
jgi:hypothetical protein